MAQKDLGGKVLLSINEVFADVAKYWKNHPNTFTL